jgi:hypothetical protein
MINRATALASSTPRRARKTTRDILATLPRPPFSSTPRKRRAQSIRQVSFEVAVRPRCDLLSLGEPRTVSRLARNACKVGASRECADPLLTCNSAQTTRNADLQVFSSSLTDSNRRPLLTMNVRRGSIYAASVVVQVVVARTYPAIAASCAGVRPWCDPALRGPWRPWVVTPAGSAQCARRWHGRE